MVLGLEIDGEAIAFPRPWIAARGGVVQTTVGSQDVLLVTVDDDMHAYTDPGIEVTLVDGTLRGNDQTWDPATGAATDGSSLERVPAKRLFAFVWQDDHGPDAFWTPA